jgi:lipid II:glycine glycyltransferase (peptidoglycan interpeptide bridge formation enzyme)
MNSILEKSTDARQTREWGEFLKNIGWQVDIVDGIYVFLRKFPLTNRTLIKIQHPKGPLPLKKIDILASKHRALFVILEPHSKGFNEKLLRQNGYQISKMRFAHSATRLIDLQQSEVDLLKSFSENARRNIKKSLQSVKIQTVPLNKGDSTAAIAQFYALYAQLGKAKKFYVPSFHETNGKIQAFKKSSVLLFATEKKTGNPIAVLWVGSVGKTLIYFHPGNTERGYELLANYALIWEAMKWGRKQGMMVFDFETAYDRRYPQENKQWKGYTEFKQKFGGELIEYPPSYIKFYNPLIKYLYILGTIFSR